MLGAIEAILLVVGIVLSGLWIKDPEQSYEPAIVLIFALLMIIEIHRRRQDNKESTRKLNHLMGANEKLQETIKQIVGARHGELLSIEDTEEVEPSPYPGMELLDAFDPGSGKDRILIGKVGIDKEILKQFAKQGQATHLSQIVLVQQGLLLSKRIFRGLQRPSETDENIYVYSWKPKEDFVWNSESRSPEAMKAPKNCVFTILVRSVEEYPDLIGIVQHWAWVEEDQELAEAPKDWNERYSLVSFETNRA